MVHLLSFRSKKQATDYLWKGDHCLARSVRNDRTRDSLLSIGYDYSYWGFLHPAYEEDLDPPAMYRLNEIKLPVLIITAEYDLESCKEIGNIMHQEIEDAELVSIRDAGHIMNMDKPKQFNRIVSDFITNLPS
jgi:pimeloyl-ACP methyl ester carboxylesterase